MITLLMLIQKLKRDFMQAWCSELKASYSHVYSFIAGVSTSLGGPLLDFFTNSNSHMFSDIKISFSAPF